MVEETLVDAPAASSVPVREAADPPCQLIEPPKGWSSVNWSEIWRYRELLYFLTWRDVKVRYKQTALGAAWAILQPFMTMVVFSIFFGRLAGLGHKTGRVPYPIYVYVGLLPWTFFANSMTSSSGSLVGSAKLITKVYFPRLLLPLAAVGVGLVDLTVSCGVLLVLMRYYGAMPSWHIVLVPLFLAGTILAATGVGSLLSALTVSYRDFQYVIPFMTQLWLFLTPVIYPSSIVPSRWRWLFSMNPMAGLIEGFRSALLGLPFAWSHIGLSLVTSLGLFCIGATYFRAVERRFADII